MTSRAQRWCVGIVAAIALLVVSANAVVRYLAPSQVFLVDFSRDEQLHVPVTHIGIPGADGAVIDTVVTEGGKGKPVIVYLHGTKGRLPYIIEGASLYGTVIAPSFPGFGISTGEPSERAVEQAVDAVFRWLAEQGTPASAVTVLGHSMGGYPAAYAAAHYDVGALYLVNSLYSAQRTCGEHLTPLMCLSTMFYFNAAALAPEVRVPTIVFHSTVDDVIPFTDGKALFEQIGSSAKRFVPIDGIHREFDVDRVFREGA